MLKERTEDLEGLYGLLKQHEKSLAQLTCSGFRVESDIFSELLSDTRTMTFELEQYLSDQGVITAGTSVPEYSGAITPAVLIEQRKAFRKAYEAAMAMDGQDPRRSNLLASQYERLNGTGQEKLTVLSAAIVGGQ